MFLIEIDRGNMIPVICFKQGLRYPALDCLQSLLDDEALVNELPTLVVLDMKHVNQMDYSIAEVSLHASLFNICIKFPT